MKDKQWQRGYAAGYQACQRKHRKRRATGGKKAKKWPVIRCSCGAHWEGTYAIDNPVIEMHRATPSCQVTVEPVPVDAVAPVLAESPTRPRAEKDRDFLSLGER